MKWAVRLLYGSDVRLDHKSDVVAKNDTLCSSFFNGLSTLRVQLWKCSLREMFMARELVTRVNYVIFNRADWHHVFCNKVGYRICDVTVSLRFFVVRHGAGERGHYGLLLLCRYHTVFVRVTISTCLGLGL